MPGLERTGTQYCIGELVVGELLNRPVDHARRPYSVSLATIAVPALVVVGANDTPFLAAADYMAAKIPGARKAVIDDAGHAANIDQPEAFNDALLGFLRAERLDRAEA